jgi:hypothetical protein
MTADTRRPAPRTSPSREAPLLPVALHGPLRAGALLCLSGGLYAATLAGIASAQQAADDATMAARQPDLDAIAALGPAVDGVTVDLATLAELQASSSTSYASTVQRIAELERQLSILAVRVAAVRGVAAQLPQRLDLPAVPRFTTVARPPRTHATTRASGG